MTSPPPIPIPQGLVLRRLPCGVPVDAGVLLMMLVAIPAFVLRSLWLTVLVLPVVGVLYLFVAYQAKKDAQFLKIWSGNLALRDYYY